MPLIDGTPMKLGGEERVIPPLSLGEARTRREKIKTLAQMNQDDAMDFMSDTIFAAVKRNYPDLSREEFENSWADLGNMRPLFQAVLGISGFKGREPGEAVRAAS